MKLATLETDGWTLDDGEVLHREAPSTFEIPDLAERSALEAGQIVKLMFRIALHEENGEEFEQVERMWVEVRRRVDRCYVGVLDNDAHSTDDIKAGMEVVFEPRHVIQIYRDD